MTRNYAIISIIIQLYLTSVWIRSSSLTLFSLDPDTGLTVQPSSAVAVVESISISVGKTQGENGGQVIIKTQPRTRAAIPWKPPECWTQIFWQAEYRFTLKRVRKRVKWLLSIQETSSNYIWLEGSNEIIQHRKLEIYILNIYLYCYT